MNRNVKIAMELVRLAKDLTADADSRNEKMIAEMRNMGFEEVKELHHDTQMKYDAGDLTLYAYIRHTGETMTVGTKGISCKLDPESVAMIAQKLPPRYDAFEQHFLNPLNEIAKKWKEVSDFNKAK